jgi:hypothetical protein
MVSRMYRVLLTDELHTGSFGGVGRFVACAETIHYHEIVLLVKIYHMPRIVS